MSSGSLAAHSLTVGGQIAWLNYDQLPATGGSRPLLSRMPSRKPLLSPRPATRSAAKYAATANTGLSYASFLVGQIDKTSFTQYLRQEFGSRFRAISPYVQDNWKVNDKLTLDLGLRFDYFPPLRENIDNRASSTRPYRIP